MSKNEKNARRQRERQAQRLAELGHTAGCLFVKKLKKLDTLNRLGRDQFIRLLNITPQEQLPTALAEFLIGENNFARCLTKSIRRELCERKLSWLSEQFVAAFVRGLLHQQALESRRLAGEVDRNVERELSKINTAPPEFGPKPIQAPLYPHYVPPGPSVSSQFVSTQGNSLIAGHFHTMRARRSQH